MWETKKGGCNLDRRLDKTNRECRKPQSYKAITSESMVGFGKEEENGDRRVAQNSEPKVKNTKKSLSSAAKTKGGADLKEETSRATKPKQKGLFTVKFR